MKRLIEYCNALLLSGYARFSSRTDSKETTIFTVG